MKLSDRLKELRKSESLTQKELAEKIGISVHSINSYESGRRTPNFEAIQKLENYFKVSITSYSNSTHEEYELLHGNSLIQFAQLQKNWIETIKFIDNLPHKEKIEICSCISYFFQLTTNVNFDIEHYNDYINHICLIVNYLNAITNVQKEVSINTNAILYANAIKSTVIEIAEIFDKTDETNS